MNFRGFIGEQVLPLQADTTLLVGANGAGKSSALDALASLVAAIPALLIGKDGMLAESRDQKNVRFGSARADWGCGATYGPLGIDYVWRMWAGEDPGPDGGPGDEPTRNVFDLENAAVPPLTPLPLLAYVHSSSTRKPLAKPISGKALAGRYAGYAAAFDNESHQFDALELWFEQEENLENQEKLRTRNLAHELPTLRAVRTALARFLSTLTDSRIGALSVLRSHVDGPLKPARGELVVQKSGQSLFLNQLSDGERRLVLLVADTARRMVVLNPQMNDALESPGLLLIDEIELHLHPRWQRTVVPALRAAFPRVQLVAATHSPAVMASVHDRSVVVIDDGRVLERVPRTFGREPNTILETVMGVDLRPAEVQAELDALFAAIDGSPRKAKSLLKRLSEQIGDDDPDLVRARAMMAFVAA